MGVITLGLGPGSSIGQYLLLGLTPNEATPLVTPDARTFTVSAEAREFAIDAESRSYLVPAA